jgi:hypothetical protein
MPADAPLQEFRVFCLGADRKIIERHEFYAATNKDAIRHARAHFGSTECELWSGSKLIAVLPISISPSPNK